MFSLLLTLSVLSAQPADDVTPASQPASQPALDASSQPAPSSEVPAKSSASKPGEASLPALPADVFVPSLPPIPAAQPSYDFVHYAKYYGPEWVADIALLSASLLTFELIPALGPAIGPTYTLETDEALLDPRLDGVIGKPFIRDQISTSAVIVGTAATIVTFTGASALYHRDFHHTHNMMLGALTALTATQVTGHILKVGVGRLRPDFRDRYIRAACAGNIRSTAEFDCDAVDDGFEVSAADVELGRRSFISGHSSTSFAMMSYFGLHAGSSLVWGARVPKEGSARTVTQVAGVLMGGVLLTGASYVAASRVTDGRHHLGDVAAGAAIGSAFGAASYFLHFELDGSAKMRGAKISAMTQALDGTKANGVQIAGEF